MIIIKNKSDISNLKLGDGYIIDYGIDYNSPESIDFDKINKIQEFIDEYFTQEKGNNSDGVKARRNG